MARPPIDRTAYPPAARNDRHAHAYAGVSVVLAGSVAERVGGTEVIAGPLSVVMKPAGIEHADRYGPTGAVLLRLRVDSEWTAQLDDGSRPLGQWRWLRSPAAARWLLRLATSTDGDAVGCDDAIAECLGALETDRSEPPSAVPEWLGRVHEQLRDAPDRRASVGELAREAGVHPVYLTRRFRRAFGCSVVGFRQQERVRAAALLADDRGPISEIAYTTGFADQAHLTRAFRRMTGVTPAGYRRLARGEAGVGIVQASPRQVA